MVGSVLSTSDPDEQGKDTYVTVLERTNHGFLVDDLSPSRIDDDAPALHRPYLALSHEVYRLLAQWDVHAQHVRPRTQPLDALDVLAPLGRPRDAVPTVIEHAHRKGMCEVCEVEADPTEPEDAEGARGQVVRVRRGDGRFPCAGVERPFGL